MSADSGAVGSSRGCEARFDWWRERSVMARSGGGFAAYHLGRSVQCRRAVFVDAVGKCLLARRHRVAEERHTIFCNGDTLVCVLRLQVVVVVVVSTCTEAGIQFLSTVSTMRVIFRKIRGHERHSTSTRSSNRTILYTSASTVFY